MKAELLVQFKHYSDYLKAKPGCLPKMTKEFSDGHPTAWLGFYPHQTFLRVLSTLFEKFEVGDRSVWMYGAYGTGKSSAALVIQKLFTDTDEDERGSDPCDARIEPKAT